MRYLLPSDFRRRQGVEEATQRGLQLFVMPVTRGDLEEEARRQQVTSSDEVRWAILENGGTISIISKQ